MNFIACKYGIFGQKNCNVMPENVEMTTAPAPAMPKYRERLGKRYPDVTPQSDAEWDELAEKAYAADEEEIQKYKGNEAVIQDLLDSDKDLAAVISEMIVNGTPFRPAVAKYYDPESMVAKEGDDDYEYYQKSREERKKMGEEFRARGEQKRANAKEAYDNIDKFAEKNGMDEKAKDGFVSFINALYDDMSVLKLTPETLGKLYKAMNYDKDVAEAAEAAEIDGKNQAIEAARVKKAAAAAGDGVPAPRGGSSPVAQPPKKKPTIFDDIPKRKF